MWFQIKNSFNSYILLRLFPLNHSKAKAMRCRCALSRIVLKGVRSDSMKFKFKLVRTKMAGYCKQHISIALYVFQVIEYRLQKNKVFSQYSLNKIQILYRKFLTLFFFFSRFK